MKRQIVNGIYKELDMVRAHLAGVPKEKNTETHLDLSNLPAYWRELEKALVTQLAFELDIINIRHDN